MYPVAKIWMRSPTKVTKQAYTPDSLSIPSAKSARNPPTFTHVQMWSKTTGLPSRKAPICGVPIPNAIINATIVDIAIAPHAITPLNVSFFNRPPISQLMTAPKSGAKMTMLSKLFSIIRSLIAQFEHHLAHRGYKTGLLKKSLGLDVAFGRPQQQFCRAAFL